MFVDLTAGIEKAKRHSLILEDEVFDMYTALNAKVKAAEVVKRCAFGCRVFFLVHCPFSTPDSARDRKRGNEDSYPKPYKVAKA